jgi:hypothetical protein
MPLSLATLRECSSIVDKEGSGRIEGIMSLLLWLGDPGIEKGANFIAGDVIEVTTRHKKLPVSEAEIGS